MERLFDLDPQLIHDAVFLAISIFVMFTVLSYLLFNPARELLRKRQEKIKSEIDEAAKDKEEARLLKADYDARIKNIEAEAEEILGAARQKALKNQEKMIEEAKAEAAAIKARAYAQIELEKEKAADDMKKEMVELASLLAAKTVSASMTAKIQDSLIEETLKEIGDDTWQS